MSIQDEAVEVVNEITGPGVIGRDAAEAIVHILADAGLLREELPEPDRGMTAPSGHVWYLPGPVGDIRANTGMVVAFGMWQGNAFRIVTTPDEACNIGKTFLAAAKYAEEEK